MRNPKLYLFLLALTGASAFLWLTGPYGLGITPDSVTYLEVASQLQKANGIVDTRGQFVNHWPPLYPLLLAAEGFLQGVSAEAGKYLNMAVLVGLLFSFYTLLRHFRVRPWLSLAFCLLLLASEPLSVFRMAWSEPLFILFTTLTALFFAKWMEGRKSAFLVTSGLLSGLALLTRYAGAGFTIGYLLYLLLRGRRSFRERLFSTAAFLLPVILLMGIWLAYSHGKGEAARSMLWHPLPLIELSRLFTSIFSWFAPKPFFIVTALIIVVALLVQLFISKKKGLKSQLNTDKLQTERLKFISLLILAYLVFLVISKFWFDAHTPLNTRILSPVFPFLLLLVAIATQALAAMHRGKPFVYTILTLLLAAFSFRSVPLWAEHYCQGSGYSAQIWRESESLAYAKTLHKKHIYTNGYDILPMYTQSKISALPAHTNPVTHQDNEAFAREMKVMEHQVKSGEAILIYFKNINWRWYLISRGEILDLFKDAEIIHFEDGFVVRGATI